MRSRILLLLALLSTLSQACSPASNTPGCSASGKTTLADSTAAAWPKFAHDTANTAHITGVRIPKEITVRWVFPEIESGTDVGSIATTALVGSDGEVYLIAGSTDPTDADVRLYVFDKTNGTITNQVTPTPVDTSSPTVSATPAPPVVASLATGASVTASPILGEDRTIFVAFGDGTLNRFDTDGTTVQTGIVGGFIAGSPNIDENGTVYASSLSGFFSAVCANGILRFSLTVGRSQSPPALSTVGTVLIAGSNGQVRAVDDRGRQKWTSFASAAVNAAILLDESPGVPRAYVADVNGWVFALALDTGRLIWRAQPGGGAPITASAALGRSLYIVDRDGHFAALDPATGTLRWTCELNASVRSSPAVATDGDDEVVIVGTDAGEVLAIDAGDAEQNGICGTGRCDCTSTSRWTATVDAAIGTASPSIGWDGTVYIGTEGGHLWAIGTAQVDGTPTPRTNATPTPTATPLPPAADVRTS